MLSIHSHHRDRPLSRAEAKVPKGTSQWHSRGHCRTSSGILRAARHPRSFVSLEGADHLLTGGNQANRAARIISAWVDLYLVAT